MERARQAILAFVGAAPDEYVAIVTPNATGACRLVGESFPFGPQRAFALTADNHNSVNGLREYARSRSAPVVTLPLDQELRLVDAAASLSGRRAAPGLLAFPLQSNFSGVRHPMSLVESAQRAGWRVLLDAASFVPTADLLLDAVHPDFVALSVYKIAGYPTGVGALVARRDALAELERPWFAGGTVQWVSVQHHRHRFEPDAAGFEDGTPPYLACGAVAPALDVIRGVNRDRLARHLGELTGDLLAGLLALRHPGGTPLVRLHGPNGPAGRGATVAISLRDGRERVIPYWDIEEAARARGIAVRGGCFCNPGCAETAFRFPRDESARCLDALGADFTIPRYAACLGHRAVGAIRISLGLGSLRRDVARVLGFLDGEALAGAAGRAA
jgi:selenocysteine lyase/cysteine desulfurase